jgi:Tol biopolymer transport system component
MRIWSVDFFQTRPPVFAPDGNHFIIPAIQANALNLELYLFDVESDTVKNISNRPLFNDSGPVWSPDGTAMVYQSANDAGQFLILDSGAEPTILLQVRSGFIRGVTWSPDQASVSFFLSQSGQQTICIFTFASETLDCPVQDADAMTWRPAG